MLPQELNYIRLLKRNKRNPRTLTIDRLTTSDKSMNVVTAQNSDWLGLRSPAGGGFFAFVERSAWPWPCPQFPLKEPLSS
jgi:hypothetical protein